MYISGSSTQVTILYSNIFSNQAAYVCALSMNFLPTPPGGGNYPELTSDDRFLPRSISMESPVWGTRTFIELSSDAPDGRNFPELTKGEHTPCLAGWGYVHRKWHSDSNGHQHLLQQWQICMCLPLEPSWHFLPTPPAEETSKN